MSHAAVLNRNRQTQISAFMHSIQEPKTPFISPTRFAQRSGLRISKLAELAGVHRNTVSRNPDSEQLQGKLRDMIRVITAAVELSGDVDQALYWFRNEPIADYRHRTAAELVADGKVEAVLAYVEDLRNGAAG